MLRVLVNGADGRMGSQVVKAVFEDPELEVAGGISITHVGEDVGDIAGVGHLGLAIRNDLGAALVWEPSRGGALFPHLRRVLTRGDVAWIRPFDAGAVPVDLCPVDL